MADNKARRGNSDRQRININEEREVRDWAQRFRVTEGQLRKAVAQVGNHATDVERYLLGPARSTR